MPRQSAFQQYLDRLSEPKRSEMELIARSAPTTAQAVKELKRRGCRCSYDAILSWRNSQKRARAEAMPERIESTASETEKDPIQQVRDLSIRLNGLCATLITLVENHQWVEEGETRLSGRQAEKLIAAVPAVARTCISDLIETSRLELGKNEKELCRAMIYEMGEDWRKTLQHDNPELIALFDNIASVTRSRLELDRSTALDLILEDPTSSHEIMPESNPTLENLPEK